MMSAVRRSCPAPWARAVPADSIWATTRNEMYHRMAAFPRSIRPPISERPLVTVQEPDLGSHEGDRHRARKSEGSDGLRAAEIATRGLSPESGSRAFRLSGEAFPGLPMAGESMLRLW